MFIILTHCPHFCVYKSILTSNDYYTELQTDNEDINTDFTYDDTNQKYYYFMEKEKLNPILNKMYDMDINDFNLVNNYKNDIAVWNGICFQYFDNGFSFRYCADSIDKISVIENYKVEDNELIIEEYAVGLEAGNQIIDFYTKKIVEDLANTNIPKGEEISRAEEYLKDHKDEFTLYKHTFKKNDTGYYWYSTEIEG